MVLDGTFIASTVVSLMMNGACCAYQMQEEEQRRDNIRADIRNEYQRQRLHDRELFQQYSNIETFGGGSTGTLSHCDDSESLGSSGRRSHRSRSGCSSREQRQLSASPSSRRRKLMADKMNLSGNSNRTRRSSSCVKSVSPSRSRSRRALSRERDSIFYQQETDGNTCQPLKIKIVSPPGSPSKSSSTLSPTKSSSHTSPSTSSNNTLPLPFSPYAPRKEQQQHHRHAPSSAQRCPSPVAPSVVDSQIIQSKLSGGACSMPIFMSDIETKSRPLVMRTFSACSSLMDDDDDDDDDVFGDQDDNFDDIIHGKRHDNFDNDDTATDIMSEVSHLSSSFVQVKLSQSSD